ncbi:hypothetical protein, partial [Escherichia coli]|uniref:hypothetical protein n=1 Tax=Escherichia coli TaxID=562 RepID=UPI000DD3BCE9
DPGPVFHTIVSIKNDGHYFCRAGGNRPDGLNEPVTVILHNDRKNNLSRRPVVIRPPTDKASAMSVGPLLIAADSAAFGCFCTKYGELQDSGQ